MDFVKETVRTLAGNGTKGSDYEGGREGTSQARFGTSFTLTFYSNPKILVKINGFPTMKYINTFFTK